VEGRVEPRVLIEKSWEGEDSGGEKKGKKSLGGKE